MKDTERAAADESAFREANETMEQKADEIAGGHGATPYLCECDDRTCTEMIPLTREQYEAIRAGSRTFVLIPGHQSPDDRVVVEEDRFVVIQKTGEEGVLVEQQDPRA